MEDKTIEELKSEIKHKDMVIRIALDSLKAVRNGALEAFEEEEKRNPDMNNYSVKSGYLHGGIKRVIRNLEREV